MGLREKLFGSKSKPSAEDECADCGMTHGKHTDWCPSRHQQVDVEEAWEQSMTPAVEDDAPSETRADKH